MSRIKLRNLINLTEQAPSGPPMTDPSSPVPAPVPQQGINTGGEEVTSTPTPNTSPQPENPSEYDFTRDFREFEDKKNKAEAEAKKTLMDKMNERLLNKTITANASRGYGQPKTDYKIENVKKISVEFWYKDYVVIATDKNDKKYFLTPGINIHIEADQPAPEDKGNDDGEDNNKKENPSVSSQQDQEEIPNSMTSQKPTGLPPQPQLNPQTEPEQPINNNQPTPNQPEDEENNDPRRLLKKKKRVTGLPSVNEWVIQNDLNTFLLEFMADHVKNYGSGINKKVNFFPYIKDLSKILTEGNETNVIKVRCQLSIPETHMTSPVDIREIKLAAIDTMRQNNSRIGQYSKGSIDVVKSGRYYLMEYIKEIGRI